MGARPAMEALIVRHLQEVLILLGYSEVPRLHYLLSGHPDRKKTNQGHTWLAWALVSMWYTSFFEIYQFLLTIYPGIQ